MVQTDIAGAGSNIDPTYTLYIALFPHLPPLSVQFLITYSKDGWERPGMFHIYLGKQKGGSPRLKEQA